MILGLVEELIELGIGIEADGNELVLTPGSDVPDHLVPELARRKLDIMDWLQREGRCQNELTPHDQHEYPWECIPDECLCYRQFGYPRICQGIPCRWVWPNGAH